MLLPAIDFANHPAYGPEAERITPEERAAAMAEYGGYLAQARRGFAPYQKVWQSPDRLSNPTGSTIFDDLVRDGIVGIRLAPDQKALLSRVAAPYVERLRDGIAGGPDRDAANAQIRLEFHEFKDTDVGALLKRILGGFELMPIVSAYLGLPKVALKLVHFKITTSDVAVSRGVTRVFGDIEFPDPRTRYFHVDAPPCDLKLIFYLSEVLDIRQGAFSYIPGSQAAPYLELEEFAVRAATTEFALERTAAGRRKLMCLPEMYRQRIDFGSDILDDSSLARDLLARERVFPSSEADMLLFDSKGLHRGAMVSEGTRLVMQATFQGLV